MISLLLIASLAGAALAQSELGLRGELERLKALLETAAEVVQTFGGEEARKLLAEAETQRQRAEQAFGERRWREANSRMIEARRLAEAAMELALRVPIQRLRTQLDERLVQEARKNQQLGERALLDRSVRGVEQYRLAIALLERALRLVQGSTVASPPGERAERARQYLAELAQRAQEGLQQCRRPMARQVYEQGLKQSRLAEEAFRRGEYLRAEKFFNGATRLFLRVIDLCPAVAAAADGDRLRSELNKLRDALASAEGGIVTASSRPGAAVLLDQARKLSREAEEALDQQRFHQAGRFIESGRNLVALATRSGNVPATDFVKQCEAEVAQLQDDLETVATEIEASSNDEARSMLELARRATATAERICQRPQHTLRSVAAFRLMVRVAEKFLLQAETLLQNTTAAAPNQEALRQRLQELEATLNEVSRNLQGDESGFARILVDQGTELRRRAQTAYDAGQLHVAGETAALAFELLREALKLAE
ncbi:hypothetical protein HUU39_01320 [candidate division KSB1 bacterium]|nr:hypothetical protein [candidate division KSB1 bacterium]